MPPEILLGGENFDQSVDVYSFAMIAFDVFSELCQISPIELIKKIASGYRPKFPSSVTQSMQQLITKCWSESSQERPTFDIFYHFSHYMSHFFESIDEAEINQFIAKLRKQEPPHMANDVRIQKKFASELLHYGSCLLFGDKKTRNFKLGLQRLKMSSERGNSYASFLVCYLYEVGQEIKRELFKYCSASLFYWIDSNISVKNMDLK